MGELIKDKHLFFGGIFLLIAVLAYQVTAPFLGVVVLALIIVTIFKPVYQFFKRTFFNNKGMASLLTTIIILICSIIPVVIVVTITANQLNAFAQDVTVLVQELSGEPTGNNSQNEFLNAKQVNNLISEGNKKLENIPGLEFRFTEENIKDFLKNNIAPAAEFTGSTLLNFVANIPAFFTGLIVFIALVGTLLPNQEKLRDYIIKLSPLDKHLDSLYIKRLRAMSVSMVRGTFIVATLQGIVSGFLLWSVGVEYVLFWGLLITFFSIIPVGAGIINIPIAIILISTGQVSQGIFLLVVSIVLTALIDNGLRPFLVSKDAYIPPVLTLIGVLGGIQVFGIIGLIYGPVIMIVLLTTLEIFAKEYRENKVI